MASPDRDSPAASALLLGFFTPCTNSVHITSLLHLHLKPSRALFSAATLTDMLLYISHHILNLNQQKEK